MKHLVPVWLALAVMACSSKTQEATTDSTSVADSINQTQVVATAAEPVAESGRQAKSNAVDLIHVSATPNQYESFRVMRLGAGEPGIIYGTFVAKFEALDTTYTMTDSGMEAATLLASDATGEPSCMSGYLIWASETEDRREEVPAEEESSDGNDGNDNDAVDEAKQDLERPTDGEGSLDLPTERRLLYFIAKPMENVVVNTPVDISMTSDKFSESSVTMNTSYRAIESSHWDRGGCPILAIETETGDPMQRRNTDVTFYAWSIIRNELESVGTFRTKSASPTQGPEDFDGYISFVEGEGRANDLIYTTTETDTPERKETVTTYVWRNGKFELKE